MEKLTLNYIGKDSWGRPVYQDKNLKLFKDVNCDMGTMELCTVCGGFGGEPDTPITYIQAYKNLQIEILGRENESTE